MEMFYKNYGGYFLLPIETSTMQLGPSTDEKCLELWEYLSTEMTPSSKKVPMAFLKITFSMSYVGAECSVWC